ncbi:Uncharacterised protein g3466 [Pycnogonum litorale]
MLTKLVFTKSTKLTTLNIPPVELPIEILCIYGNLELRVIPPNCFEKFPKLKFLKLSENAITRLPANVLKNPNQVNHVELQLNNLLTVPLDLLNNLPEGAEVILGYNVGITTVRTEDITTIVQRKLRVYFDHLAIDCNCDFKILATMNEYGMKYGIYGTCARPSQLSGKRFSELETEHFKKKCPARHFFDVLQLS